MAQHDNITALLCDMARCRRKRRAKQMAVVIGFVLHDAGRRSAAYRTTTTAPTSCPQALTIPILPTESDVGNKHPRTLKVIKTLSDSLEKQVRRRGVGGCAYWHNTTTSPRYLVIWQDIAGNGGLNKWLLLLASFCTTLADGRPHTGGEIFFSTCGSNCQPGN